MFAKMILQENYKTYNEALLHLGLQDLELRRKRLSSDFTKRSLADGHFGELFKKRKFGHMKRKRNYYKVTHANTERVKKCQLSPCRSYWMKIRNWIINKKIVLVNFGPAFCFYNCTTPSPNKSFSISLSYHTPVGKQGGRATHREPRPLRGRPGFLQGGQASYREANPLYREPGLPLVAGPLIRRPGLLQEGRASHRVVAACNTKPLGLHQCSS